MTNRLRKAFPCLSVAAVVCLFVLGMIALSESIAATPQVAQQQSIPSSISPAAVRVPAVAAAVTQQTDPATLNTLRQLTEKEFKEGWLQHVDELKNSLTMFSIIISAMGVFIPVFMTILLFVLNKKKGENEQVIFANMTNTLAYMTEATKEISEHRVQTSKLHDDIKKVKQQLLTEINQTKEELSTGIGQTKDHVDAMAKELSVAIEETKEKLPGWLSETLEQLKGAERIHDQILFEAQRKAYEDLYSAVENSDGKTDCCKEIIEKMHQMPLLTRYLKKILYGGEVEFCEALEEISDSDYMKTILPMTLMWNLFGMLREEGRIPSGVRMGFLNRFAEKTKTLTYFDALKNRLN